MYRFEEERYADGRAYGFKKAACTENHLFLLNVLDSFGINGLEAQTRLESVGITTNKNMIHGDTLSPKYTSGLRIGFAAAASRGCTKAQAIQIAGLIYKALKEPNADPEPFKSEVKGIVSTWTDISKLSY